jgi:uncharacterized membrane protein
LNQSLQVRFHLAASAAMTVRAAHAASVAIAVPLPASSASSASLAAALRRMGGRAAHPTVHEK